MPPLLISNVTSVPSAHLTFVVPDASNFAALNKTLVN
jgi:hypothetical protein